MDNKIIFQCNSLNNKNVREGELKILEKHEDELYFIFGESNVNTKKRYYKDLKTLNEDFEKLKQLKENNENKNAKLESKSLNTSSSKNILPSDEK